MGFLILGLILIWIGGMVTGYALGVSVAVRVELAKRRVQTSDLYPKRDTDDAS